MSKQRILKDSFWSDSYIERLDPSQKLMFIYLITNSQVEICGIYELSIKRISYETGFEENTTKYIIDKFQKDGKIYYIDGYVYIKNFKKHLAVNPSIVIGIERSIKLIPSHIKAKIDSMGTGSDSLGTGSDILNLTLLNLTSSVEERKIEKEKTEKSIIDDVLEIWNSVELPNTKGLPKTLKVSDTNIVKIRKKLKNYTIDEFKTGLNNYLNEITTRKDNGSGYINHRFTLPDFIIQSNGLDKFINL